MGRPLREAVAERAGSDLALRESEACSRTTLRSIGDGVVATDVQGRVTFLNPVAEQLTEWPLDEAIGQPVERIFVGRARPEGSKERAAHGAPARAGPIHPDPRCVIVWRGPCPRAEPWGARAAG